MVGLLVVSFLFTMLAWSLLFWKPTAQCSSMTSASSSKTFNKGGYCDGWHFVYTEHEGGNSGGLVVHYTPAVGWALYIICSILMAALLVVAWYSIPSWLQDEYVALEEAYLYQVLI